MKQLFVLCLAFALSANAQAPSADEGKTSKGPLVIQPVFHGCLTLTWNKITIYIDPYGGANAFKNMIPPDLILITDIHGDHLNLETLKTIHNTKAIYVVPRAVANQLPDSLKSKMLVLANGEKTKQLGISVTAVPMYNLPEEPESKHVRGRGNGYLLEFGDKTLYISGDTEDIPEMRHLKNIDVAFVCMNLPYTMGIDQAASAVLEFKPKIVYPYHYRGKDGLSDTEAFKKLVNEGNPSIDVRLRNWYTEYQK